MWRPALAAAAALAVLLPGLGAGLAHREQELRVLLTARDVAANNHWLAPAYLGEARLRKPPLMYWAVAAAYRLAGDTASVFAARLPAALAGAGLCAALAGWGAACVGRRRALVAALMAATSLVFVRYGRLAETDVAQACFVTASALAGWQALRAPGRGRWWIVAGGLAGLAFLTKGVGALLAPAAWAAFLAFRRRFARRALSGWLIAGLALSAALAAGWYAALAAAGEGARAGAQAGDELARLFGETRHPGPPWYYALIVFQALAPWSLLLPWALAAAWRNRRRAGTAFALAWFASTFVMLSLLPSKQLHYATLFLGPAPLLLATLLPLRPARLRPAAQGVARRAPALLTAAAVLTGIVAFVVQPRLLALEPKAVPAAAARTARPFVKNAPDFVVVGAPRAMVAFYADRTPRAADDVKAAWQNLPRGGVLLFASDKPEVAPDGPAPAPAVASAHRSDRGAYVYRKP